jgi:hypothetical protein
MAPRPIDQLATLFSPEPDLSVLEEPSWGVIKESAGRYGVAGLVAYLARAHVSPTERKWCDRVLTESWRRHLATLGHLQFILALLEDEHIPAIALKGPLLAERYYTPAFLRKPCMDLDLAIRKTDIQRACTLLSGHGYVMDASISESLSRSHHVTLRHPFRPTLELHFRLSHMTLGIPVDEFFDRAVKFPLPNGHDALVLAAPDQILHLVLHLAHSRFGTLFHLSEIKRVCAAEPLSVAAAVQRGIEHRFCGALRMTDIAFRVRLGTSFLPDGMSVPTPWLNSRLNEKLYSEFESWSEPGNALTLKTRFRGRWLDLQILDSPWDAIRWALLLGWTARFHAAKGLWGTAKHLKYVPGDK